ncbi:MAG: flagellar assembly protein FliW [Verrucomicrobiota bacterium]
MKTADTTDVDVLGPKIQGYIHLPLGLLGFERIKEYLWIETAEELPFRWLQARTDPTLTFLIVPAFEVLREYAPEISDEDAAFLGLESSEDALIFGIVTLRPHGRATVNLKGPIILHRDTQRGKQVVLTNAAQYPLQYPLPTAE